MNVKDTISRIILKKDISLPDILKMIFKWLSLFFLFLFIYAFSTSSINHIVPVSIIILLSSLTFVILTARLHNKKETKTTTFANSADSSKDNSKTKNRHLHIGITYLKTLLCFWLVFYLIFFKFGNSNYLYNLVKSFVGALLLCCITFLVKEVLIRNTNKKIK